MWQHRLCPCAVFTEASEGFAPHYLAEIRHDLSQTTLVPVGIPVFVRCAACGGSGRDWYSLCLACQGHGLVETEHTIHVHIPPRAWEGAVVEVPLHGRGIHNFFLRLHIRITG